MDGPYFCPMEGPEKLDILFFAAHPDDAEISAGGSILRSIAQGLKVGIVDMTRGELGSRGSAELRDKESAAASRVLGIHHRANLGLKDGFFADDEESRLKIIQQIRRFRPQVVVCNSPTDRHPDHGRASEMVRQACFYSGLMKIQTSWNNKNQEAWRPAQTYHYIQDYYLKPDFVIDVTEFWEQKIAALKCYSSQFFDPDSSEPSTPISGAEFFDFLKGRALQMGRPSGILLAEGFIASRTPAVNGFGDLK